MRLWHLLFGTFVAAISLAIWKDDVGRVAWLVFWTCFVECAVGLAAIMALFQSIGAIGHAQRAVEYAGAIAATAFILFVGSVSMAGVIWVGVWLVLISTS
jgi:hypothetical protein